VALAGGERPSVQPRGERAGRPRNGFPHSNRKELARRMMTAFRAMVRKDLRLFFVDRRALIMSFAAPIAIASFFGYALGGSGQTETSKIAVLAIDQDGSAVSREILHGLTTEKALDLKPATEQQAREAVRKGSATVAVAIPKGFQDRAGQALFAGGQKPEIPL